MAKEIDQKAVDRLAKVLKQNPGNSEKFYAEKANIPQSQILQLMILAELQNDPKLKIPATGPSISKARDQQGLRWPRIAGYAGISVAEAQRLYQEHTKKDPRESYTGRGRNWSGTTAAKPAASSGRRGGKAATTGTSGRRGSRATRASASQTAGRGRRGSRAAAADPK